jgi:hypothetical protein
MKFPREIAFEFVDTVPPAREEGKLYISIKYRTAIHSCFCGCGMKVVTPIRATGWRFTYDGDTVTLYPSIGNWSFRCRSHYWIEKSRAIPAGDMPQARIEAGRQHDSAFKDAYFSREKTEAQPTASVEPRTKERRSLWRRLLGR